MSNFDLSNLTPEQEQLLIQVYRFIRQRAAYLRAQKAAADPTIQNASRLGESVSGIVTTPTGHHNR